MKEKKQKPQKVDKKNIFYYLKPKNLQGEITGYGYVFDMRKTAIGIMGVWALTVALGVFFNLSWFYIFLMCLADIMCAPKIIANTYRYMYEQRRFFDLNEYMEQFLYSFKSTRKIYKAMEETKNIFKEGPMRETIDKALANSVDIDKKSGEATISERAFAEIEFAYPCQKLKSLHRFCLKAESIGGEYESTIDLLQRDRMLWEERNKDAQQKKKTLKTNLTISLATVYLICMAFVKMLTITSTKAELLATLDVSRNIIVQISSVALWVISILTYIKADDMIAVDWLTQKNKYTDKKLMFLYDKVVNWDNEKEIKKSIKYAIITAVIGIAGIVLSKLVIHMAIVEYIFVGITALAFPMLLQHRADYRLSRKTVILELEKAFPGWLTEVALYLQTSNVASSIYKSYENAPEILKPEISKMYNAILKDPTTSAPFLAFLEDFNIRNITSAMKILYSIKNGMGNDYNKQIEEVLEKNNEMLNRAEEISLNDQITALKAMFAVPSLCGGAKLGIDMIVFFYLSLVTFGNII